MCFQYADYSHIFGWVYSFKDFHSYNSSEKLPIFLNISIIKENKRIQYKKVLLGAIGKMYGVNMYFGYIRTKNSRIINVYLKSILKSILKCYKEKGTIYSRNMR